MKKCKNCDAEMEDISNFCPRCGTRCEDAREVQRIEYPPEPDSATVEETAEPQEKYHLKWHHFLMVVMIFGGIISISNGLNTLSGMVYTTSQYDSKTVYAAFPGLRIADVFYGAATIALGIYEFVVRSRLNRFCENGPSSLRALYILSIVVDFLYTVWASATTHISFFTTSLFGSIGLTILLLILNSIYYSKRSELFVYY